MKACKLGIQLVPILKKLDGKINYLFIVMIIVKKSFFLINISLIFRKPDSSSSMEIKHSNYKATAPFSIRGGERDKIPMTFFSWVSIQFHHAVVCFLFYLHVSWNSTREFSKEFIMHYQLCINKKNSVLMYIHHRLLEGIPSEWQAKFTG